MDTSSKRESNVSMATHSPLVAVTAPPASRRRAAKWARRREEVRRERRGEREAAEESSEIEETREGMRRRHLRALGRRDEREREEGRYLKFSKIKGQRKKGRKDVF